MARLDMRRYGAGMAFSLARGAHNATNSLHSLIYFVPETEQHLTSVGLRAGRMCYFAGRAAPMGAVGAGVVTATFYNFNPHLVARSIPVAWDLASPEAVADARLAAADAALTRLLGPDVIASADMTTMAALLRDAAGACGAEGRPLYAGHADLGWPDAPHLVMWHAVTLLREHRGDGHTCALACAGLSGIEALVTHTATGQGIPAAVRPGQPRAGASRVGRRRQRPGGPRPARRPGRADPGRTRAAGPGRGPDTDRLAAPPWQHLGERANRGRRPDRQGHDPSRRHGRRLPPRRRLRRQVS